MLIKMMKNIFKLILLIILLSGCSNENRIIDNVVSPVIEDESQLQEEGEKEYREIPISLYYNSDLAIEKNYYFVSYAQDIVFSAMLTNNATISNSMNTKYNFLTYYNNITDLAGYHIGYYINFTAEDVNYEKYIYRPNDILGFFNYIQIYLYDDIHQNDGAWYSHVTEEEYNENTMLTSIKLTGSVFIDKVSDVVVLGTFIYKDDEIIDGKYLGPNMYKFNLIRK